MPTLSLCMMVRNEEANLSLALASFAGLADEIVVADTGSTDRTREVALEHGARVADVPWNDDFSEVRNIVFSMATGDWIFHLDGDEALLPESHELVRHTIADDRVQGALILRQDLRDENRIDHFTEMWQLRLFRRKDLPPQIGRCHPNFCPSLESVAAKNRRAIYRTKIRIRHWGYLANRTQAKLERGIRLMKLELADRPGQFYYLAELSRSLVAAADPDAERVLDETLDVLEHRIGGGEVPGVSELLLLELLLGLPANQRPPGWPISRIAEFAQKWFPKSAPLSWQLARDAFSRNDFPAALRWLEEVRKISETGDYDRSVSFDPNILGDELWLNLGVCQFQCGDSEGAIESFRRIDLGSSFAESARLNLMALGAISDSR